MHFFNPVPLMSLVEVIRGLATSDETYGEVRDLALKLGKTPVEVRDYPGFVSNRVLMPMINEAIFALFEGCRYKGRYRQCNETRYKSPYGTTHPGRLHRP